MIENSLHQKYFEKYSSMEGLSRLALLNIKEKVLQKERRLIGLEKDIFMAYLELLGLTDMLVTETMIKTFPIDTFPINKLKFKD